MIRRKTSLTLIVFFIVFILGGNVTYLVERNRQAELRKAVTEIGASHAHSLERQLDRSLSATFALASILHQSGGINGFDALADDMIQRYGGIDNLALAPGAVVTEIYPLAGNEAAIGHDLLNDPNRRTEVLAAIESKALTLAGPFELIQGGMAITGRYPVFLPDETTGEMRFWGLTVVLIRLPELLEASHLSHLVQNGYDYELSRPHPDTGEHIVFASSTGRALRSPVVIPIEVPNGRWRLAVEPQQGWLSVRATVGDLSLTLFVTILVTLLAHQLFLYAEALSQTNNLTETLREVTLALAAQTSHDALLDEILRQMKRIVPYSTANIALLEGDTLHTVRSRGYEAFGSAAREGFVQSLLELPSEAEAIQQLCPLIIVDTYQDPRWVVYADSTWIRSHLAVPICQGTLALGMLRLDSEFYGQFTLEDAQRLQPLAHAAAIAIQNARLVQGLETEVAARTIQIRAEQEKGEAILRSVGDAIIMVDLEMRIEYVNAAFTVLTGYTAAEALGQSLVLIAEIKGLEWPLGRRQSWQHELTGRRKDGRTFEAALIIAPVHAADGALIGYVSSLRDVSHSKELERARQRFITHISHELRTPVTSIKLYTKLLQVARQPEKHARYADVLATQATRLENLVQDILEITRLDSGEGVTEWRPVHLPDIIEAAVQRYQRQATADGLRLQALPLPADLPAVQGDAGRLEQALSELVENAVLFAPAGSKVQVACHVLEKDDRYWLAITVHDSGPGIAPEEQEHIFDRFYRGSFADSGHIPGTGLGLAIAQEILHAHGGLVTLESANGSGNAFSLLLPANGINSEIRRPLREAVNHEATSC